MDNKFITTTEKNKWLGYQPSWNKQVNSLYSRQDFMPFNYFPDERDNISKAGRMLGMGFLDTSPSADYFFNSKNIQKIANKTEYDNDSKFIELLQNFFRNNVIISNIWDKKEGERLTNLAITKLQGTRKQSSYHTRLPELIPANALFYPDRPVLERKEKLLENVIGFSKWENKK